MPLLFIAINSPSHKFGTVKFKVTFHIKISMSDSQKYPFNLSHLNYLKHIVIFSLIKCSILTIFSIVSETQLKTINFNKEKDGYLTYIWSYIGTYLCESLYVCNPFNIKNTTDAILYPTLKLDPFDVLN